MNPGKLEDYEALGYIFTPSFNLLELEARILQHGQLEELSHKIAHCVRCGKCKPNCCVYYPGRGMFFHPRNKNLAIGSLIEALLYDAQRKLSTRFELLPWLEEVADHCTICHKCLPVCPSISTPARSRFWSARFWPAGVTSTRPSQPSSPALSGQPLAGLQQALPRLRDSARRPGAAPGQQAGCSAAAFRRKLAFYPLQCCVPRFLPIPARPCATCCRTANRIRRWSSSPLQATGALQRAEDRLLLSGLRLRASFLRRLHGRDSHAAGAEYARGSAAAISLLRLPCPCQCQDRPALAHRSARFDSVAQIRGMFADLDFDACVVTCGTCREGLAGMEIQKLFNRIVDASAYLLERGLNLEGAGSCLYHAPCHDSLDGKATGVLKKLGGFGAITPVPHCCSEAGTLSLSRPDITDSMLDRKREAFAEVLNGEKRTVLTNCPSCLQGLGRMRDIIKPMHIAVALAEKHSGPEWKKKFLAQAGRAAIVSF
jgi:Fe-S oxidoreductase